VSGAGVRGRGRMSGLVANAVPHVTVSSVQRVTTTPFAPICLRLPIINASSTTPITYLISCLPIILQQQ